VAAVTVAKGCDAISLGTTVYSKQQMVITANLQTLNSGTLETTDFFTEENSPVTFDSVKWVGSWNTIQT
jgi:hypothetical protein